MQKPSGMAVFLVLTAAFLSIAADDKVERGKYIVHHLAMCIECHTPRTADGRLIESEELHGAPIPVPAPSWVSDWAVTSVNIDGIRKWTDEEAINFLMTARKPDGTRAKLPMPRYRMNREDAEAVVAYLRAGHSK
jgi:mono/diheme cytochrome c family protein